jgi:hypothetical protein
MLNGGATDMRQYTVLRFYFYESKRCMSRTWRSRHSKAPPVGSRLPHLAKVEVMGRDFLPLDKLKNMVPFIRIPLADAFSGLRYHLNGINMATRHRWMLDVGTADMRR